MDLIFQLTRAQLLALEPCPEGVALFDRLVPSGVFRAETSASATMLNDSVPVSFRAWLGPVMLRDDGYGFGYGYGYGVGYGFGSGYGDGYGDGSGDGSGDGRGAS